MSLPTESCKVTPQSALTGYKNYVVHDLLLTAENLIYKFERQQLNAS